MKKRSFFKQKHKIYLFIFLHSFMPFFLFFFLILAWCQDPQRPFCAEKKPVSFEISQSSLSGYVEQYDNVIFSFSLFPSHSCKTQLVNVTMYNKNSERQNTSLFFLLEFFFSSSFNVKFLFSMKKEMRKVLDSSVLIGPVSG